MIVFAAMIIFGISNYSAITERFVMQTPRNGGNLKWQYRTKPDFSDIIRECVTTKWGATQFEPMI